MPTRYTGFPEWYRDDVANAIISLEKNGHLFSEQDFDDIYKLSEDSIILKFALINNQYFPENLKKEILDGEIPKIPSHRKDMAFNCLKAPNISEKFMKYCIMICDYDYLDKRIKAYNIDNKNASSSPISERVAKYLYDTFYPDTAQHQSTNCLLQYMSEDDLKSYDELNSDYTSNSESVTSHILNNRKISDEYKDLFTDGSYDFEAITCPTRNMIEDMYCSAIDTIASEDDTTSKLLTPEVGEQAKDVLCTLTNNGLLTNDCQLDLALRSVGIDDDYRYSIYLALAKITDSQRVIQELCDANHFPAREISQYVTRALDRMDETTASNILNNVLRKMIDSKAIFKSNPDLSVIIQLLDKGTINNNNFDVLYSNQETTADVLRLVATSCGALSSQLLNIVALYNKKDINSEKLSLFASINYNIKQKFGGKPKNDMPRERLQQVYNNLKIFASDFSFEDSRSHKGKKLEDVYTTESREKFLKMYGRISDIAIHQDEYDLYMDVLSHMKDQLSDRMKNRMSGMMEILKDSYEKGRSFREANEKFPGVFPANETGDYFVNLNLIKDFSKEQLSELKSIINPNEVRCVFADIRTAIYPAIFETTALEKGTPEDKLEYLIKTFPYKKIYDVFAVGEETLKETEKDYMSL